MKTFLGSLLVLFALCADGQALSPFPNVKMYRWPQTNVMLTKSEARNAGSRKIDDKSNVISFTPNMQQPGGVAYLSEFSEEKHPQFSSYIPGFYSQQQPTYYSSYQPVVEKELLNQSSEHTTEESTEHTTQASDDFYEYTTEKTTDINELLEKPQTTEPAFEAVETTTDKSEVSALEENFSENSLAELELNYVETSTFSSSGGENIDIDSTSDLLKYCWVARGQFPSPNSCKSFINCWDDVAVEQECGGNTLFNDRTGYCDYPEAVDCGNRPIAVSDSESQSDCSIDYATFRNPYNCSEYFVCISHQPVKFVCGPDLYYNLKLKVCDYKRNVYCEVQQHQQQRPKREITELVPVMPPRSPCINQELGFLWPFAMRC